MSDLGTIVIVAPDVDLRRSLAFALQTEGYAVKDFAELTAAGGEMMAARCSIVDAKVLRNESATWRALGRARGRTILLTNGLRSAFQRHGAAAELVTPFSGTDLVTALAGIRSSAK